ncbi:MAG: hypothetical protein AB1500_11385 [Bacillota bacterium]
MLSWEWDEYPQSHEMLESVRAGYENHVERVSRVVDLECSPEGMPEGYSIGFAASLLLIRSTNLLWGFFTVLNSGNPICAALAAKAQMEATGSMFYLHQELLRHYEGRRERQDDIIGKLSRTSANDLVCVLDAWMTSRGEDAGGKSFWEIYQWLSAFYQPHGGPTPDADDDGVLSLMIDTDVEDSFLTNFLNGLVSSASHIIRFFDAIAALIEEHEHVYILAEEPKMVL